MSAELSIVIVSYNTRELTVACVASVLDQTSTDIDIYVIDNMSGDGSAEAIEATFGDKVHLIRAEKNLGFAAANNHVCERVKSSYILLLNPDTVVLDHAVDRLLAFAKTNPRSQIWGGKTLDGKGNLDPTSVWRRFTAWSAFCQVTGLAKVFKMSGLMNCEAYGGWLRDSVRDVDIVTGCFLLIERRLWEELKGFNPDFFMYGEEADLCLRAHDLGARPRFCPEAVIIHYGGASETSHSGKLIKLLKAKCQLIKLHWPAWQRPIGKLLMWAWGFRAANLSFYAGLDQEKAVYQKAEWQKVWSRRNEWLEPLSKP